MLTRTKAQFRAQYRKLEKEAAREAASKPVRVKDPNAPLTKAQIKALYDKPAKIYEKLQAVEAELAKGERVRLKTNLRHARLLREEYLEAQTKLAVAFNDPRYRNQFLKLRLLDTTSRP